MLGVKILIVFILLCLGWGIGYICGVRKHTLKIQKYYETHIIEERNNNERMQLAYSWLNMYIRNKFIADFFFANNITSVAIYGYGINGKVLEKVLSEAGIKPVCIIDKEPNNVLSNIPVYSPEDSLPPIDVLVVTSVNTPEAEIEKKIKGVCKVMHLRAIMMVD